MSMGPYHANKHADVFGKGQTPNPFYTIANQFVPRNFHDVIKWSRYILTQSPTAVEVLRKLSTYPITDFIIESTSKSTREKYQEVFNSIKLKSTLNDVGFDYHTLGNVFVSMYFPIKRMLVCPHCGTSYSAENGIAFTFHNFTFRGDCANCDARDVTFDRKDLKSESVEDINVIKWAAEHMSVNHNPITGNTEYFYSFPNSTKRRILNGDPNFVATVPWSMIMAVKNGQDFKFDKGSIFHLKSISMGNILEGLGMPPVISLYSSIFHQALLKRANEAIATEHLTPFRVLFPQQGSGAGDPISMMSLGNFVGNMEDQLKKFKGDPNHITIAPVPIGSATVGGQGRALMVSQELQFNEESMLLGMGVSRELLSGTTNWTSSSVGLRLLTNTLHDYTSQIEDLIQWITDKIASYLKLPLTKVSMTPFELTDNVLLKEALPSLMNGGKVSDSTVLKAFGIDFHEELDQIRKDSVDKATASVDTQHAVETAVFMKTQDIENEDDDDNGFREVRMKAADHVRAIIQMQDPELQSNYLFELYNKDRVLYGQVAALLKEYMSMRSGNVSSEADDHEDEALGEEPVEPSPGEEE